MSRAELSTIHIKRLILQCSGGGGEAQNWPRGGEKISKLGGGGGRVKAHFTVFRPVDSVSNIFTLYFD